MRTLLDEGLVCMSLMISLTAARYPPRDIPHRTGERGTPIGRLAGGLFALTWLPAGFYIASAVATGEMSWPADSDAWLHLAVLAPGGLPLALACGRLRRRGHGATAWTALSVLAPVTAAGAVELNLLFGLLAVMVYAAFVSLPAWLLHACLRFRRRAVRRSKYRPVQ